MTTADDVVEQRRPKIIEDFDREVYGCVPKDTPKVNWEVTSDGQAELNGDVPVIAKRLVGHLDNSRIRSFNVDIQLTLTTPENADDLVPIMMELGFAGFPRQGGPVQARPPPPQAPDNGPTWQQQCSSKGWGYAILSPDKHPGGQWRWSDTRHDRPDATRGSRAKWMTGGRCGPGHGEPAEHLDYFETDKAVDAETGRHRGPSRYGKAALVTMAYDGASRSRMHRLIRGGWGEDPPPRRAVENAPAQANTTGWPATSLNMRDR